MDNFDLRKYLIENKLTANSRLNEEAFDITKEVQLGDVLVDVQGDMYEVVAISPSQVELEPFNFKGDNSIFPDDFGNDVSIEDFWQHLTAREEEEPRGMFGEPWDSDYFGNHIRENKLTKATKMDNFDLRKYLAEGRLDESASVKAFKNLKTALSKYKNVRAGSDNPVDDSIYEEIEALIRQL